MNCFLQDDPDSGSEFNTDESEIGPECSMDEIGPEFSTDEIGPDFVTNEPQFSPDKQLTFFR